MRLHFPENAAHNQDVVAARWLHAEPVPAADAQIHFGDGEIESLFCAKPPSIKTSRFWKTPLAFGWLSRNTWVGVDTYSDPSGWIVRLLGRSKPWAITSIPSESPS